jgi:acetolactate synthase-1/2/3 large subunit
MLGADALLRTLASSGVDVCFANPGTSELHLTSALDRVPDIRPVLVLAEAVASGAADGFARISGRPATTLLHLGPGLANALANLHNARRAGSAVVNLVGDHASAHRLLDPPLASDIEALARVVSRWVDTVAGPDDMARAAADAVRAAQGPPKGVATLVIPADASWGETRLPEAPASVPAASHFDATRVEAAARLLRGPEPAALLVGGEAAGARGARAASRIANASGARVFCSTFTARATRGAGHVLLERLPYFPEMVLELLAGTRHLVLAEAASPVGFFAYPGLPGSLVPERCDAFRLADADHDVVAALEALADALGASPDAVTLAPSAARPLPAGPLDANVVAGVLGALLPEDAIVADEAVTARFQALAATVGANPHDWLCQTGGSLGLGMPLALGAAIAAPGRRVVNLQADGSAMYAPQALWSFAREGVDVTTILLRNRRYRILDLELQRLGLAGSARARDLCDIGHPDIDYVALAGSMGVRAERASTAEGLARAFARSLAEPGPCLIEAVFPA